MSQAVIYSVSGASNHHRAYVLRDGSMSSQLVNQRWGTALSERWEVPSLVIADKTASLPEASFTSLYVPGLLVTTQKIANSIAFPELECLPARLEQEQRVLLNPKIIVTRFHEEGAQFVRVPSGAIIMLSFADFFLNDIPNYPAMFWFHDGNAPRFLLCNEAFHANVSKISSLGLSFQKLGHAK